MCGCTSPIPRPMRDVSCDTPRREWKGNDNRVIPVAASAMSDAVGLYLNEIGQVSLLNAEEERELSRAIEAGAAASERIAAGDNDPELDELVRVAHAAKDRFIR